MTTQEEFVKKESEKHLEKVPNGMVNAPLLERSFANGLTKGLDIAAEFGDWLKQWWVVKKGRYIHKGDFYNQDKKNRTTSELLTIFLTEKSPK